MKAERMYSETEVLQLLLKLHQTESFDNLYEWFEQAKEIEKEQRQELYNETEVLQLLIKLKQTESFDNLYEWFEKNKKK